MHSLIFACLLIVAYSGSIIPHDVILSPNNINSNSIATIIFTPETSLAPNDYLKIVFPFKLDNVGPAFWDNYIDCSTEAPTKFASIAASTITADAGTNTYFIQFFDDMAGIINSNLTGNITYYLTINITIDSAATTGLYDPLQMYTVSSNKTNYIAYDSNPVFGTLALAGAISPTLGIAVSLPSTVSTATSTTLGSFYTINIDVSPTITINNGARIDITLVNNTFSLLSCQASQSPNGLSPAFTASFEPIQANSIRATLSSTFSADNQAIYRFQCMVHNSVYAASTNISVSTMLQYADTIIETGVSTSGIQAIPPGITVGAWDETQNHILLGWGYDASAATAIPIFTLYKDASATEKWYQSVQVQFNPINDLSVTQALQVIVNTVNDPAFAVLTASIYHNLPAFSPSVPVNCTPQANGTITCQNVGQLQAQQYFVSFRFNVPTTVTATAAPNFGKVMVQTQETTPQTVLPSSQTGLANNIISTNVPLYTGTGNVNGIIASSSNLVTSTTGSSSASTPTSVPTTYVNNNQDIILQFTFNYFTNTIVPTTSVNEIDYGLEFYTSNALASSTTPNCTISTLTQDLDVILSDCGVDQFPTYTRARFRLAEFLRVTAGTPPLTVFGATAGPGTVLFNSVNFGNSFSSLTYVNENVFDYYSRWVQGFTAGAASVSTAASSSPFFFNSLVYSSGALQNVQVGTTFFATTPTAGNIGTDFPTLLRITGYLAPEEQQSADRLLVFFNDLTPLDTENPCFGPPGIQCNYVQNTVENTQTNTLTDYSGSRVIEINTDLTQRFNIYIPVQTLPALQTFGFFIATASSIGPNGDSQNIYATMNTNRIPLTTYTTSSLTVNPAAAPGTPMLNITAGTLIGASVTSNIINIPATYLVTTPNSATAVGAAYAYCGNYDFTLLPGFSLQPFYATTQTPEQLCVKVQYLANGTKEVTCQVCPVHIAMTGTSVAVTNIQMPTLSGRDYEDLVFVAGGSTGTFQIAARDDQTAVLTSLGLPNFNFSFTPETLTNSHQNFYSNFTFTIGSPLPSTIQINIVPANGSTSLLVTPVTSINCLANNTDVTSCVVSGSDTNLQLAISTNGNEWAPATYSVQFMLDTSAAASAITADTNVSYSANITVTGMTGLNSVMYSSPVQQYLMKDQAISAIQHESITYLITNIGARTIIQILFSFPDGLIFNPGQQLTLNLGDIASSNHANTGSCLIRDSDTMIQSNDFGTCQLSDLTNIILTAKVPVTGSFILELGYLFVPTSQVNGVTAKLIAVDGSTVIMQSPAPLALPTPSPGTIGSAGSAVMKRLYTDIGNVAEYVLTVTPSIDPITTISSVYVYFPPYYSDNLGYTNLWCTAGGVPVYCPVIQNKLLEITSFSQNISVGSSLEIRIYGIITPVMSGPTQAIFVGISAGGNISVLSEYIEIGDQATAALPTELFIDSSSVSNNFIRDQGSFSWSFTTDSTGIGQGTEISISFPDSYGMILDGSVPPTVLVYQTGDNNEIASVLATAFGSRFKILLPLALAPLTSYTFVIQSIETPDYPVCRMDRPVISIANSAETSTFYRTAPPSWSGAQFTYVPNPKLKLLNWADQNGNQITSLNLTVGIMSPEIRIIPPPGENFYDYITFSAPQQTGLTFVPNIPIAMQGSPYLSLILGVPQSTPLNVINHRFNQTESSSRPVYSKIPYLQIVLSDDVQTIPVNEIRIVKGGMSLPYSFDLGALGIVPQNELDVEVTIPNGEFLGLSTVGPSILQFTSTNHNGSFYFILESDTNANNPPTFKISLSGPNAASYQLQNKTITVTVLDAPTNPPSISQLAITSPNSPTTETFSFQVDQMASVYWHVAYQSFLDTTDCLRVRMMAEEGTAFDPTSANQEQYGIFYVYNENQPVDFQIENLLTSQAYSYILCPFNQLDALGTSIIGTFQTQDNQAALFEIVFSFSDPVTDAQLTLLLCLFSENLELPNGNVVAMDGTTCAVPTLFDSFDTFDYSNPVIYVHGDRRSDYVSTTRTALSQYISIINNQTPSDFLDDFNDVLSATGLSSTFVSIALEAGPIYPLPVVDTSYRISADSNDTAIFINGLALSSGEGVFFGVASTGGLVLPTETQVRLGLDANNNKIVSNNVCYEQTPVSLVFGGLEPDTDYIIYYYAANGDRTPYARETQVYYIQTTTLPSLFGSSNSASKMQVNAMIFLIISLFAYLV